MLKMSKDASTLLDQQADKQQVPATCTTEAPWKHGLHRKKLQNAGARAVQCCGCVGLPIGRHMRRQVTPGMVSTDSVSPCCALWKALMLSNATSNACRASSSKCGSGMSCMAPGEA